ncbi:uncharacterized protein L3040_009271 [Drepanopeziza brunnea f. sp. 'multigermtubi']|uniref:mRNA splicing factor RNA helicase n=1 Tax=Marssonina brunnea f. sp. multigermtubi (strain MB_m1) TaxID=1072389 RepID=K1Y2B0_MARBU|nr:uncharacterized protein MBM_02526 [Drepanopeziza brunnea f. sp. 'multigermtubi' MB_m1]EKD19289.1 hypothetical protein MBM_02526 [Drepanopeziza brunnea f. sp. 'multigermtubi' MB_m1]KAJ5032676.1 hypothetical protein L3040_009271 [Drepanopeziza brunnea f. sp. 'multigermtubi']
MSPPPPPSADQIKADPVLFRPTKKRKIYRQRTTEDEIATENVDTTPSALSQPAPTPTPAQSLDELISAASATASGRGRDEVEEDGASALSVAEILRLRKKNKARGGGVEFRALGHVARDEEGELMVRGGDEEKVDGEGVGKGVIRVFAPQTGTVGDVNRHMMAYIDSELAKRRAAEGALAQPLESALSTRSGAPMGDVGDGGGMREKGKLPETQRQPASIGKLQEIDLGDEARDRNIKRTTNAQRRLNGEIVEEEEANEGGKKKKKKVRLNRDGSVWVPRKRRGSDDIKRDQLVEAVLRENKLEIYEEPAPEPEDLNDDQAADDRIAEAFRKDFLDAVSQKHRRRPAAAQAASRGPGGKKEEESRGPKLGGSRSARAAMREAMLAKAKK